MVVAEQRVVSIKFILRNKLGEEIENNMEGPPISFIQGSGHVLPELGSSLIGLQPGDRKSITVYEDRFAGIEEEGHFEIMVTEVRKATDEELRTGRVMTDPIGDPFENAAGMQDEIVPDK